MPKLYNHPPQPRLFSSLSRNYSRGAVGDPCSVTENAHVIEIGSPWPGWGWVCLNKVCFLIPPSSVLSLASAVTFSRNRCRLAVSLSLEDSASSQLCSDKPLGLSGGAEAPERWFQFPRFTDGKWGSGRPGDFLPDSTKMGGPRSADCPSGRTSIKPGLSQILVFSYT